MSLLAKRPNNLFSKIYLGVFIAFIMILLLGSLLIFFTNQVRVEAYQEKLLQGLLVSLASHYQQSDLQPHAWLHEQRDTLGLDLTFANQQRQNFSDHQVRRLDGGRPLIKAQADQSFVEVYFPTHHPGVLLKAEFERLQEQQLRAAALLFKDLSVDDLEAYFHYPLKIKSSLTSQLDPLQLERLNRGEPLLIYKEQPQQLTAYLALEEDKRWLQLGPVATFNPYPLPLIVGILGISLLVLGASIWWFLHGLGQRLRSLERASSQLAAGNLEARVDEKQNDFIGKLASTFNHMADQIQRLLGTQQEMIHAVSHELRTPVARIRFGLQMIEDLSEEGQAHQQLVRQIQGIDKDIDELDTLIDEILTYARLGQEKLQLQFTSQEVTGLISDVIEGFQRVNPQIHLELQINNPSQLSAEADLEGRYFQRALQNLIGNAVRYAQGEIRVTCHLEADNLRVDVEDNGPGIPEEDWQRVFMPFSRLDNSRTRSSGGYGLGLSIVQRIVYWHRGSALVDRSPQLKGARFSLIFPKHQTSDLPPLEKPPH